MPDFMTITGHRPSKFLEYGCEDGYDFNSWRSAKEG
jgi:hypothetical protein